MADKNTAGPTVLQIPEGDSLERLVCPDCGYIEYSNPKIIVGAVSMWGDQFLMCRRSIEPRAGYWTFPAGFMEMGETMANGAMRETWEEARARIKVVDLIGIFEIPHISQVQVFYRADMISGEHAPGPESTETRLVTWNDIPWDDLAFPSITWALERHGDQAGGSSVHLTSFAAR